MEPTQIEERGLALVERSRAIAVVDAPSYTAAGEWLVNLKGYRAEVAAFCEPVVKAAHAAHKAAVAQRTRLDGPADEAERIVKTAMLDWKRAEDARVAEAQRAMEREARRQAEERQLAEAQAAEEAGDHAQAEALAAAPTFVPPVFMAPAAPKVAGIATKKTWKYRIVDATQIPRDYLVVDEVKIGRVVRAMGALTRIPGVTVYADEGIAVRGRA